MAAGAMTDGTLAARSNRRVLPRFPVDEDATLHLVNHGSKVACRVVDISEGGCRLLARERFQAGIMVRVEVNFKVRGLAFRFSGVTQWSDGRHQVGIRFVDVIPRRRQELIEALEELATELAAKEAKEAKEATEALPDDPANDVMPDDPIDELNDITQEKEPAFRPDEEDWEVEEEVAVSPPVVEPVARPSYLEALFSKPMEITPSPRPAAPVQSRPLPPLPPTPSTPEPATRALNFDAAELLAQTIETVRPDRRGFEVKPLGPLGPPVPPPAGAKPAAAPAVQNKRERRTQERHAVDTTAILHLVKIASRLSSRILDLSMNGCRIRSDERFPVGIYTRIEIEFHLEGLPFRLGGVVQSIHDRHHVGIRFLDVSDRKREQLKQLIEEIKEMYGETHKEVQWTAKSEAAPEAANSTENS